jgi:hypothetical protein
MTLLAGFAMVLCFLWPMRRHVRRLKMPGLLIEFERPESGVVDAGAPPPVGMSVPRNTGRQLP